MKKLTILIAALLFIVGAAGCSSYSIPEDISMSSPTSDNQIGVEIINAYCMDTTQSLEFPFRFTLKNLKHEEIEVIYYWSLNDPKADAPGSQKNENSPLARQYQGQGKAQLPASGTRDVEIQIKKTRDYDPRFYVMYVSVYRGNTQVGYYREQKSTYDWDYSTIPPKPVLVDMTSLISISPSLGALLTNLQNVSSEVVLRNVQVIKTAIDKRFPSSLYLPGVKAGDSILIVSGTIQNTHKENKEIAMYAEGYDETGEQVAWTLDAAHIAGQIGLHLENEQISQFNLHLKMAERIRSIRLFANNYSVTPPK